eukprot:6179450-Pleurochrysis_carterae.AAC.3
MSSTRSSVGARCLAAAKTRHSCSSTHSASRRPSAPSRHPCSVDSEPALSPWCLSTAQASRPHVPPAPPDPRPSQLSRVTESLARGRHRSLIPVSTHDAASGRTRSTSTAGTSACTHRAICARTLRSASRCACAARRLRASRPRWPAATAADTLASLLRSARTEASREAAAASAALRSARRRACSRASAFFRARTEERALLARKSLRSSKMATKRALRESLAVDASARAPCKFAAVLSRYSLWAASNTMPPLPPLQPMPHPPSLPLHGLSGLFCFSVVCAPSFPSSPGKRILASSILL